MQAHPVHGRPKIPSDLKETKGQGRGSYLRFRLMWPQGLVGFTLPVDCRMLGSLSSTQERIDSYMFYLAVHQIGIVLIGQCRFGADEQYTYRKIQGSRCIQCDASLRSA
jgi:hypothetical protein